MEIIGYILAVGIGVLLGLIGGGGSILTVPVLVYFFHLNPVIATGYSLFIVGVTALVGVIPKFKSGMVHLPTAIIFGIPSIVSVYLTRAYLLPIMPDDILVINDFILTKSKALLLLFALLMIASSFSLIKKEKNKSEQEEATTVRHPYPLIIAEGLIVGVLTGLVGAGGGFLIIPALVLLSKLPMKTAIGTSLLIIGLKSSLGFAGDLMHQKVDWTFLFVITLLAISGIFIGNRLVHRIQATSLKKSFGWMVLSVGIAMIIKEIISL